uniref:fimbrial protein n=1 Tax=Castellaniella defragrans TaxID=75697 RepID=UPI00334160A9
MKLSHIAGLLAGIGIMAGAQVAVASSGVVNVHGKVVDTTCAPSTGFDEVDVDLDDVFASALQASGTTASPKAFTIKLSQCDATAKVYANFETTTNVNAAGRLKNIDTADPATNVDVVLTNMDDSQIDIQNQSSPVSVLVDASGNATLQYKAAYYSTGSATKGAVEAQATYLLAYE